MRGDLGSTVTFCKVMVSVMTFRPSFSRLIPCSSREVILCVLQATPPFFGLISRLFTRTRASSLEPSLRTVNFVRLCSLSTVLSLPCESASPPVAPCLGRHGDGELSSTTTRSARRDAVDGDASHLFRFSSDFGGSRFLLGAMTTAPRPFLSLPGLDSSSRIIFVPVDMSILYSQPRGQATPSGTMRHSGVGTATPFTTCTTGAFAVGASSGTSFNISRGGSRACACPRAGAGCSGTFFNISGL